ncbi:ABC transporter substrate-binding protein [Streptacidiphilus monticola]|uniref:ABC transporter substrate-binding protein n=1 Tax=Streptacidiphilus monticola TaxID=2161674 RepID=A0ABW1G8I9_9ACTN
MSTVKRLAVVGAVGLIATTSACGSSGSGAAPNAASGAKITIGSATAYSTLDPAVAYDAGSWAVYYNIYQSLLSYAPGANQPSPDAAKTCGFSDPVTYKCELRPGLKFTNGDPLDAAAVKFSIDRVLKIKNDSQVWTLLSTIKSVDTPNSSTVVFNLNTPDATLPDRLAAGVASIVDPKLASPTKGVTDPTDTSIGVGSGVYKIDKVDFKDGQPSVLHLSVNPAYQGAALDNGGKLQNSGVTVNFYDNVKETKAALDSGAVDAVATDIAPTDIVKLQNDQQLGKGLQVVEGPGAQIRLMPLNLAKAPFNNKAVRVAIARLLNRDSIASGVFQGTVTPLYSMIPSGITDQNAAYLNLYPPASAATVKRSLQKAGVHLPVSFTLDYTLNSTAGDAEAKMIKAQLESTGLFQVTLRTHATYTAMKNEVLKKGDFDAYTVSWLPDYPDPDDFVSPFVGAPSSMYINYQPAAIVGKIAATLKETDRLAAAKDYADIQNAFANDAAYIPIWQNKAYAVTQADITGAGLTLDTSAVIRWWLFGKSS